MKLYHYTCSHAAPRIKATGLLLPNSHPHNPEPLVWLTDLDVPWREALGLTSTILDCDRTEWRFTLTEPVAVHPWVAVRRRFDREYVRELERAHGVMPMHWFVSTAAQSIDTEPRGEP